MSSITGNLSSSLSTASALSALSAASSASSAQKTRTSHVDVAADALGMSKQDVTSALKSGKSLFDLADAQGVSHDDLVAALKAGAPDDLRNSDDADAMIEALASTAGLSGPGAVSGARGPGGAGGPGGGGHHGPPPPPPGSDTTGVLSGTLTTAQQSTLDSLSELLGTSSSSLLSSLQSGTDLATLLSSGGIDLDRISSTLEEGLLVDTRA